VIRSASALVTAARIVMTAVSAVAHVAMIASAKIALAVRN